MEKKKRSAVMPAVLARAAFTGTALGVALVALFALILQQQWLGMESIPYVNTSIKLISAAAAAIMAVKRANDHTLLWGAAAGGAYMLVSFIVFSLISGRFSFSLGLAADFALCMTAGVVIGIIRNLKR